MATGSVESDPFLLKTLDLRAVLQLLLTCEFRLVRHQNGSEVMPVERI